MLGGDGLNGKIENGHYFVANHGGYTEVTRDQWWFSAIHHASIFVTGLMGMAAGAYLAVSHLNNRQRLAGKKAA